MSDHLSPVTVSALADGELLRDQLAAAQAHLAECAACTNAALSESLLKVATRKAGVRYTPSQALEGRIAAIARQHSASNPRAVRGENGGLKWPSLAAIAAAILMVVGISGAALWTHRQSEFELASANRAALETELLDQHIATLAANSQPQVLSSDRHTVKPWFQGKLPFSFNLPENLPADTRLEGADLTYIHGQPAALLLYSIGKHRVSVFVTQRSGETAPPEKLSDQSGFHVTGFITRDLDAIAVSDCDPGRLSGLVGQIYQAQSGVSSPAN
jgi:anti-sigma factor RsiW